MKFKDLDEKILFTWWERDQHHTGVKIGGCRVFCFDTMTFLDVHANKDVKELDNFDETLQYKVGRDGRGYLCSSMDGGKVLARRIILIGSEIMNEETLKTVSHRKDGGEQTYFEQVYIMWNLLEKKLHDLNTLAQTVRMLLDDNVESETSDNKIMSTSLFAKGRALTE